MQGAQDVAALERKSGGRGGRFAADLAVPPGEPAGLEQQGEAGIEVARELHEGVLEQALREVRGMAVVCLPWGSAEQGSPGAAPGCAALRRVMVSGRPFFCGNGGRREAIRGL